MNILVILSIVFLGFVLGADIKLKVGDMAPDFSLPDQDSTVHKLSDYKGQKVVVYFYPKDDTPGCTKEACSLRDNYSDFSKLGIRVFGISYDTPESHRKFRKKYNLPFTLLSDETKEVSKLYGASGVLTPKRITFLIKKNGKIVRIYDKVTVTTHGEDILQFFTS